MASSRQALSMRLSGYVLTSLQLMYSTPWQPSSNLSFLLGEAIQFGPDETFYTEPNGQN